MTTTDEMVTAIDDLLRELREPLSDAQRLDGWTAAAQQAMTEYFEFVQAKLRHESVLPATDLGSGPVRALDAYGVVAGHLLDHVAAVTQMLRRSFVRDDR